MKKSMKNLIKKLTNNPIYGLVSSLTANILYILVLLNIKNYLSLSRKIFIIIVASLTLLVLIVNILFVVGYSYKKKIARQAMLVLSLFVTFVFGFSVYYTIRLNKSIDALIDVDSEEILEYSFVSLNDNITLDNLYPEDTIAYVLGEKEFNDAVETEISSASPAIEMVTYDRYDELLESLVSEDGIELAVLPKHFRNYAESLPEEVQEELLDVNVIHEFDITLAGESKSQAKVLDEPFSILLTGINENLADSIILATVNPKTLGVTMTSIARDSFVPISCYRNQAYDQINHARAISRQCLINTVENMFDIEIDFFLETDFYALVKIVDVLDGLELESPIAFGGSLPKEENPNEFHEIWIKKGKYVMTGNEVITFARERYHFQTGDFQRQLNQQYVIKELSQKIFTESRKNPDTLIKVIKAAESNIVMDLSMDKHISPILGHAINNIAASPVGAIDTFLFQSTQIQGAGQIMNDVWYLIPYDSSIQDIKDLIHSNMSLEIPEPQKESFTFSINHPVVFGLDTSFDNYAGGGLITNPSDHYEEITYDVPDFTTMSLEAINSWGHENDVEIAINYINESHDSYSEHYDDGQIIYQSVEAGEYLEKPTYIEVSIVDKPEIVEPEEPIEIEETEEIEEPEKVEEPEVEKEPEVIFIVPELTSMSLSEAQNWANNNGVTLKVNHLKSDEEKDNDGQIIYQSTDPGKYPEVITYIEISVIDKSEED